MERKKYPVILDTDIGDDIDDSWALGLLLKSPEIDLKMVMTGFQNTSQKAKIVAKFLSETNRTDIPIAIGKKTADVLPNLDAWSADYVLSDYPGVVYNDGIDAAIKMIMESEEKITIIAIGPVTNLAAALEKEPKIAEKADIVAMFGSIYKGYEGTEPGQISAEWNVKADIAAAQKVFEAKWAIKITPLDTCGDIYITGDNYRKIAENKDDAIVNAIMQNYVCWSKNNGSNNYLNKSSVLFDTVAAYMAFSDENVEFEDLPVVVDSQGYTRISDKGKYIRCAVRWTNKEKYIEFITARLAGR